MSPAKRLRTAVALAARARTADWIGWLRGGCVALVVGVLAVAAVGELAAAQTSSPGRLVQLAGSLGCIHQTGMGKGCARGRALDGAGDVALSPDGRHAYTAASFSNAVAAFARDRGTGALRQLAARRGCVSHWGDGPCAFGRALAGASGLDVSPDGRNVYVAATASDAVVVFARNRKSGALRQLPGARGCISQRTGGPCVVGRGLNGAVEVIVSPDGRRVYVASQLPGAVAGFVRGRAGALTQPAGSRGCISQGGRGGCAVGRGLDTVWDIAASPEGDSVFAAGFYSDSVAILRPTTAGLSQPDGEAGCLARAASEGCAVARALIRPAGLAVSPDGRTVYVASYKSHAVAILRRNKSTRVLTQAAGRAGCISQGGRDRCTAGRALFGAQSPAISPDGRNLYVAASNSNAIGVFARSRSDGTLKQLAGSWGCFNRGGGLGCHSGRGLYAADGVAVSPAGHNVYVGSLEAIGVFRRLP